MGVDPKQTAHTPMANDTQSLARRIAERIMVAFGRRYVNVDDLAAIISEELAIAEALKS